MFIALDADRKLVEIEDASFGNKYFCKCCGGELKVKAEKSEYKRKHFAHISLKDCDSWEHDMSEWHLNWQKQFPIKCREVVMIDKETGEKHRADVFIVSEWFPEGIVIEFQHSSISREEILERTSFYNRLGYKVVWVFDANGKIKHVLNKSIDPLRCKAKSLRWKTKKSQFEQFPKNLKVEIFLQYEFEDVCVDGCSETKNILICLREIGEKELLFHKTVDHIQMPNILKEYGAIEDTAIPSVSDLIDEYKRLYPYSL